MQEARVVGFVLTLMIALLGSGCQRRPVPLSPVLGKISYRGVALPGGTIVFTPDASRGETGAIATGRIEPGGTYQLFTGETTGAAPGWYRVTVVCHATSAGVLPGERFAIPPSLIPDKYRSPELSGLGCEVKAARPNTIDFNLE